MNNHVTLANTIPAMSDAAIAKVCALEDAVLKRPQFEVETQHVLHGGMYARTMKIPANGVITGALIKIPTTLVVSGDVIVFVGDERRHVSGYKVFAASANRKQAFFAISDTYITMSFPTKAATVAEAEKEFTDDYARLMSRKTRATNDIEITGE